MPINYGPKCGARPLGFHQNEMAGASPAMTDFLLRDWPEKKSKNNPMQREETACQALPKETLSRQSPLEPADLIQRVGRDENCN